MSRAAPRVAHTVRTGNCFFVCVGEANAKKESIVRGLEAF